MSRDKLEKQNKLFEYRNLLESTNRNLSKAHGIMNLCLKTQNATNFIQNFFFAWKTYTKAHRRSIHLQTAFLRFAKARQLRPLFTELKYLLTQNRDLKLTLFATLALHHKHLLHKIFSKLKRNFLSKSISPVKYRCCSWLVYATEKKVAQIFNTIIGNFEAAKNSHQDFLILRLAEILSRYDLKNLGGTFSRLKQARFLTSEDFQKLFLAENFYERSLKKKCFRRFWMNKECRSMVNCIDFNEGMIYRGLCFRMVLARDSEGCIGGPSRPVRNLVCNFDKNVVVDLRKLKEAKNLPPKSGGALGNDNYFSFGPNKAAPEETFHSKETNLLASSKQQSFFSEQNIGFRRKPSIFDEGSKNLHPISETDSQWFGEMKIEHIP
jgi:hypothetical protein